VIVAVKALSEAWVGRGDKQQQVKKHTLTALLLVLPCCYAAAATCACVPL